VAIEQVWETGRWSIGWRQARTKEKCAVQIKLPEPFLPVGIGVHAYPASRASKARGRAEPRHARPMKGCAVVRAWVLVLVCFVGTCLLGSFPCAVLESYKQSSVRVRRDTRKNRELVHAGLGAQLCHYHQGRREELRMMRALAVSSNFFSAGFRTLATIFSFLER